MRTHSNMSGFRDCFVVFLSGCTSERERERERGKEKEKERFGCRCGGDEPPPPLHPKVHVEVQAVVQTELKGPG